MKRVLSRSALPLLAAACLLHAPVAQAGIGVGTFIDHLLAQILALLCP